MKRFLLISLLCLFSVAQSHAQTRIFDSHLHYGDEDAKHFSPQQVFEVFDRNKVDYALISSTPNSGTEKLYLHNPERIIPFLGLYQSLKDKRDWMWNEEIIPRVERALKKGFYRGIGELHIFAKDRRSPVLKRIVEIAAERNLFLQVHGDAEILEEIFSIAPNVTVLWAHLGTKPEPKFLQKVLERFPQNLYIDTSVRDKQLLETGKLTKQWRQLFIQNQDRFMVAVDTFSVNRWNTFDSVIKDIHSWLADLPPEVADKLAYRNAYGLFF